MPDFVNVKGIGQLPTNFSASSDNVDFDMGPDANSHNEGRIYATCQNNTFFGGDFFRDSFVVTGHKQAHTYLVTIDINSEVSVALWNHGRVNLTYDEKTKNWQMNAELDGREWTFCDSNGVITRLIDGLRCMGSDKKIDNSWRLALNTLAKSLSENKTHIAKEAPKYTKSQDCNRTIEFVNGPDGEVPWW